MEEALHQNGCGHKCLVLFAVMFAHMCVYVSVCVDNNYVYKNSL